MSGTTYPSVNTATLSIAGNNAAINNVSLATYPPEGSRTLTAQYNWSSVNPVSYAEDLSALVARGFESTIQGAYIDNTECCYAVALYVPGTMQQVIVPAFAWKYVPLFLGVGMGYQLSIHQPPISATSAATFSPGLSATYVVPLNYTRLILVNCPVNPADGYVVAPGVAALAANISASTIVKQGPGILNSVVVTVVTANDTIVVGDSRSGVGLSPTVNSFLVIPIGAPVGTIYPLNVRFTSGLRALYNTTATGSITLLFT